MSASKIKYAVDLLTPERIAGWAYDPKNPEALKLSLHINDESVGTFRADLFRPDLTRMREDGKFAFRLTPFEAISWEDVVPEGARVQVCLADTGEPLGSTEVWPGKAPAGQKGLFTKAGERLKLNKGTLVVPLGERSDEWRQSQLHSAVKLASQCAAEGFVLCAAYGTLLGGVRDGTMIPHDDDLDLMFISTGTSMYGAVGEFQRLAAFLNSHGHKVKELSNGQMHAFVGSKAVDIFLAWFEGEQLCLTFTIKHGPQRDDIFPLQDLSIDGVPLPAPRNPELVLEAIYGPSWMVPDPAFAWRRPIEIAEFFAPIHNYQRSANQDYWQEYYSRQTSVSPPTVPSQFALFALAAKEKPAFIVELGCGSGRDSFFFAAQEIPVLGIDYAESAVDANCAKARQQALSHLLTFQRCDVSNLMDCQNVLKKVNARRGNGPLCVYSRFFFHAIDLSTEGAALLLTQLLLKNPGDFAVFEFRTESDRARRKVTPDHYRRYINVEAFVAEAGRTYGLKCVYRVEGTGYAIFREDDAYVARLIFIKDERV